MNIADRRAKSISEILEEIPRIRKDCVNPKPTTIEQYDLIRREVSIMLCNYFGPVTEKKLKIYFREIGGKYTFAYLDLLN